MPETESFSDPATEMTIAAFRLYPRDPAGAAKLFLRAAEAGNENAKLAAARMLIDGDGINFDPRRALQLLAELCGESQEENMRILPLLCRLAGKLNAPCRHFRAALEKISPAASE